MRLWSRAGVGAFYDTSALKWPKSRSSDATLTVVRKRRRFSGIARIVLGTSGEDASPVLAPYATTPRAIRAIPENRPRFRTTL